MQHSKYRPEHCKTHSKNQSSHCEQIQIVTADTQMGKEIFNVFPNQEIKLHVILVVELVILYKIRILTVLLVQPNPIAI
jgi:hypothetical protein